MKAAVRALWPLLRPALIAWWRWALRELQQRDPSHPDIPEIVRRLRDLEATHTALS
jgi:hypothetical protein